MRARKSNVPVPRSRIAKTSCQAVFLIVRATAAHSNPRDGPFNFIPRLRFPSCVGDARALTVRPVMGFFLRRAGLALVSGFVIFCCSCERHQVDELPLVVKEAGAEGHGPGSKGAPEPRQSPANFFPNK